MKLEPRQIEERPCLVYDIWVLLIWHGEYVPRRSYTAVIFTFIRKNILAPMALGNFKVCLVRIPTLESTEMLSLVQKNCCGLQTRLDVAGPNK